jgi:hypothetical protein
MVCDVTFDVILSNSVIENPLPGVLFTPGNAQRSLGHNQFSTEQLNVDHEKFLRTLKKKGR